MNRHKNIIKIIKEKYTGIDYNEGEDMTVLWIYGIQAEDTIKALEKQIPKKPTIKHLEAVGEKPYTKLKCPNCHSRHSLGEVYDKYCKICGQKIDWS